MSVGCSARKELLEALVVVASGGLVVRPDLVWCMLLELFFVTCSYSVLCHVKTAWQRACSLKAVYYCKQSVHAPGRKPRLTADHSHALPPRVKQRCYSGTTLQTYIYMFCVLLAAQGEECSATRSFHGAMLK